MKLSIEIDISKKTFDVAFFDGIHFDSSSYDYTDKDIENFISLIKKQTVKNTIITMEATGIYHLQLAILLHQEGFTVSVVNPLIIKRFSQMKLSRVKTDKADAKIIAEYGFHQKLCPFTPEKQQIHHMKQILSTINGLTSTISQIACRIKTIECDHSSSDIVLKSLQDQYNFLKIEVRTLEKEIVKLLDEIYPEEYKLLLTIPGVGKRTAAAFIAYFGSFEKFDSPKKVSSYIGMCPSPYQSGTSIQGAGYISKRGNAYLRKVLYMASLSAFIYNKQCHALFTRITGSGKSKKLALIAVSNKLIRQMYGVIKHMEPYNVNCL